MTLLRPYIPVEVRCRVVLRQLGEMWPDRVLKEWRTSTGYGHLLELKLCALAELLACTTKDLRLDHDPALAIRKKLYETPNGGHRWSWQIEKEGKVVRYEPDANDPEHLRYRPHAAQHAGSHHIKTNVRGDGAQHPDRVLIKRLRRREKKAVPRHVVRAIGGRPVSALKAATGPARKFKWPSRPMKSANRWQRRKK